MANFGIDNAGWFGKSLSWEFLAASILIFLLRESSGKDSNDGE